MSKRDPVLEEMKALTSSIKKIAKPLPAGRYVHVIKHGPVTLKLTIEVTHDGVGRIVGAKKQ